MEEKVLDDAGTEMMRAPRRLVGKLRVIAAARRRTMLDLLEEYAGGRIDAEHRAVIAEQAAAYEAQDAQEG